MHDLHGGARTLKIRDENFHFASGDAFSNGCDGQREKFRASIFTIVTIHAGDDRVLQPELLAGFGNAARLVVIDLQRRSFLDGAESAAPGADVAQDHEGRGAAIPTFTYVRTRGALTHRVEFEIGHQTLQLPIIFAHGSGRAKPGGPL